MDPIVRSSSVDTLSKQLGTLNSDKSTIIVDDYLLLSCHINAYSEPPKITYDKMPISTPDYVKARKSINESDLYFIQWVFKDVFDVFNDLIARDFPGYNIFKAEVEPGISWDDFRSDKRGLLVWLVKMRPEPFAQLSKLLDKTYTDEVTGKNTINKYELAIKVLSKQVASMRRQIKRFRKEMDQSEHQFDEVWKIISHALDIPPEPPLLTRANASQEPPDWSVVEDETDDHDLTSASLSGYDYDSASDI